MASLCRVSFEFFKINLSNGALGYVCMCICICKTEMKPSRNSTRPSPKDAPTPKTCQFIQPRKHPKRGVATP